MEPEHEDSHLETYGEKGIASHDAPVPRWLKISYVFWVIFGFMWMFFFWNGSYGWLDRGYWQQLQRAANTTYPFQDTENPSPQSEDAKLNTEETQRRQS